MGLYRFHPGYQKHLIKGSDGDISFTSVWMKKAFKWEHVNHQRSLLSLRISELISAAAPVSVHHSTRDWVIMEQMRWRHLLHPNPPPRHPLSFCPPIPSLFPVAFLLFNPAFSPPPFFFYHLALIFFVMFSTFGVLSSLISPCAPSPPSPAPYLSTLYCFSPSSTGTSSLFFLFHRFSFFLLQGTRSSLSVLLSCACTHTRTT